MQSPLKDRMPSRPRRRHPRIVSPGRQRPSGSWGHCPVGAAPPRPACSKCPRSASNCPITPELALPPRPPKSNGPGTAFVQSWTEDRALLPHCHRVGTPVHGPDLPKRPRAAVVASLTVRAQATSDSTLGTGDHAPGLSPSAHRPLLTGHPGPPSTPQFLLPASPVTCPKRVQDPGQHADKVANTATKVQSECNLTAITGEGALAPQSLRFTSGRRPQIQPWTRDLASDCLSNRVWIPVHAPDRQRCHQAVRTSRALPIQRRAGRSSRRVAALDETLLMSRRLGDLVGAVEPRIRSDHANTGNGVPIGAWRSRYRTWSCRRSTPIALTPLLGHSSRDSRLLRPPALDRWKESNPPSPWARRLTVPAAVAALRRLIAEGSDRAASDRRAPGVEGASRGTAGRFLTRQRRASWIASNDPLALGCSQSMR